MVCILHQSLFRQFTGCVAASTVATLSDLVEQAAGRGDFVAIAILEESARELARAIAAVYPNWGHLLFHWLLQAERFCMEEN